MRLHIRGPGVRFNCRGIAAFYGNWIMRVNKLFTFLISLGLAVILAGCTSQESKDSLAAEKERQRMIDRKNDAIEDAIDNLPRWAKKVPKPDSVGIYGLGISDSSDLSMAIRKSLMQAEFAVASAYQNELSGSDRLYSTEGPAGAQVQYQGLIDKLIQRVPIVGYAVREQKIQAFEGKYQVLTLLHMPYDEYNQALRSQRAKAQSQEMKDAFDDLERRLDKRRAEELGYSNTENKKLNDEILTAPVPDGRNKTTASITIDQDDGI